VLQPPLDVLVAVRIRMRRKGPAALHARQFRQRLHVRSRVVVGVRIDDHDGAPLVVSSQLRDGHDR
jgi:hypothetical protein